jgi:hypothetical protein
MQTGKRRKRILIVCGVIVTLVIAVWLIINAVHSSTFRITKVYHIQKEKPYLMACMNKTVKKNTSALKSQDFTVKNRSSHDTRCVVFQLVVTEEGLTTGQYYALLSAESESGDKITEKDIPLIIVDGKGENTLPDEVLGNIIDANNDNDMEEWMSYWRQKPIYKYVDQTSLTYKGAMWSIALRADNNNPMIVIIINMPSSSQNIPRLAKEVDLYKKSALNQLSEWGIGPDDYKIEYKFTN